VRTRLAALLIPALLTFGLPEAGAQTTEPPPPGDPTIIAAGDNPESFVGLVARFLDEIGWAEAGSNTV